VRDHLEQPVSLPVHLPIHFWMSICPDAAVASNVFGFEWRICRFLPFYASHGPLETLV